MKKYLIWFLLLMKRMLKKKAFWLLLIALPILAVFTNRIEQKDGTDQTAVGILFENGEDQELAKENVEWRQRLFSLLQEQDGVLIFQIYEEEEQLLLELEKGELDCALVLPGDLRERLKEGAWQSALSLYTTSSSALTEIVKERIASILFILYSEDRYIDYIENSAVFLPAQQNGSTREEIVLFARNAYEMHLLDGSTFAFQYHGEEAGESEEILKQEVSVTFRLRGVLAVCIFLSGLCGLLTDWEDRKEKRFQRLTPNWLTTIVNIWIPTIYTSAAALISLTFTGQLNDIGKEIVHILLYQFLIVGYCSIIKLICRKQESIVAAIPILTLASMICAPVWVRLSLYLPVFQVLEKLFPVTYYLLVCGRT